MYNLVAAVLIKNDNVILQMPEQEYCGNEDSCDSNKYEFPGGAVKLGESKKEAIRRELYSDLTIDITLSDIIDFKNSSIVTDNVQLTVFIIFLNNDIILDLNKIYGEIIQIKLTELQNMDNLIDTDKMMIPAIIEYFYPSDIPINGAYIYKSGDDINILIYYKTDCHDKFIALSDSNIMSYYDTTIVVFQEGRDYIMSGTLRDIKDILEKFEFNIFNIINTDYVNFRHSCHDSPYLSKNDYNCIKKFCKKYIKLRSNDIVWVPRIKDEYINRIKCGFGAFIFATWVFVSGVVCRTAISVRDMAIKMDKVL